MLEVSALSILIATDCAPWAIPSLLIGGLLFHLDTFNLFLRLLIMPSIFFVIYGFALEPEKRKKDRKKRKEGRSRERSLK